MGNSKIFQSLEGRWNLDRQITPHGHFSGEAVFSKIDDTSLAYSETGQLSLDSGDTLNDVSKRYIFSLKDEGISVYFDDGPDKGKLFHTLNFDQSGTAEADHFCKPDTYHSRYQFHSDVSFVITHDVSGPYKDYKIKSCYSRV
ncbi:MAG: DUF6314 family protein [Pseudomonadota bacterium]